MTASDAPLSGQFSSAIADAREADRICDRLKAVQEELSGVIFGQDAVIRQALTTVLSGGHALLVGPPGLGKTLLVNTLGTVLGLDARRVQFTPDLMPSDITGGEILDEDAAGHRSFRFVKGPVFCQLLMADEINRASPRTQSALLQAMQEHHVTVAGVEHALPRPFHVLATQNPFEQEGTYPLPEAQLDRFMLQIPLDFPAEDAERQMLLATTGVTTQVASPIMNAASLIEAQALVRRMPVGEKIVDAILTLVRSARPQHAPDDLKSAIAWGPGPRAAQTLMLTTRARALLDGRLSPSLDDVVALAQPVLAHRMAVSFSARADGLRPEDIIARLVKRLS
ncbi:MoxR family ATPase [Acetobacter sp. TBRC 12305]|uniref:MoxR family ATPase n=1 Tax=Acetobacter garciniae TaxID=2817435 RepID=A0A939HLW4_9PROT|nr:MoxR family ATPase [Acetobacter garciniae]MBO1323943.1 MoxR family ATPase [Acetobacter garciniae]MBX0343632.1 MoxR family ATPase [Acetobacter garciniae]